MQKLLTLLLRKYIMCWVAILQDRNFNVTLANNLAN